MEKKERERERDEGKEKGCDEWILVNLMNI